VNYVYSNENAIDVRSIIDKTNVRSIINKTNVRSIQGPKQNCLHLRLFRVHISTLDAVEFKHCQPWEQRQSSLLASDNLTGVTCQNFLHRIRKTWKTAKEVEDCVWGVKGDVRGGGGKIY